MAAVTSLVKGIRLGHASDSAMVLTCTYPRARFDDELRASGADPIRELAFETTYTQVNLALHQIRTPGARPDGLIGSLVRSRASRRTGTATGRSRSGAPESAPSTKLASWQSGFSLAYPEVYVIVHACGIGIDEIQLVSISDEMPGYDVWADPLAIGAMHWELWRSRPELGYDDLTRTLVTL